MAIPSGRSIATEFYCPGDLLYTDFHPVTVYGDIPNWIRSIDHLLAESFASVVPGHGPISRGGEEYQQAFEIFRNYLRAFHSRLLETKAGRMSAAELGSYMTSGAYAHMGKPYMVKRNIENFAKSPR